MTASPTPTETSMWSLPSPLQLATWLTNPPLEIFSPRIVSLASPTPPAPFGRCIGRGGRPNHCFPTPRSMVMSPSATSTRMSPDSRIHLDALDRAADIEVTDSVVDLDLDPGRNFDAPVLLESPVVIGFGSMRRGELLPLGFDTQRSRFHFLLSLAFGREEAAAPGGQENLDAYLVDARRGPGSPRHRCHCPDQEPRFPRRTRLRVMVRESAAWAVAATATITNAMAKVFFISVLPVPARGGSDKETKSQKRF